ncbi:MAG: tRNA pseudouridine(38-40) synthase TruA [Desulfobacterales bacterium]|jgi:tRNA pseudouridine38-40 synthase|nr:tRNA pseudouridine(38-40) synthase TruA [Desulfobacterales bacterium]
MLNFRLTIEYDGSDYSGWQRQSSKPTVQAEIEKALATMTRSAVTLHGAGRTDAGVHALGQVASFRCDTRLAPDQLLKGLNSLLPPDIAIRECCRAPEEFHARFSAKSKRYGYRVLNREVRSALERRTSWFLHTPLDLAAMQQAADRLCGRRDFKAFESAGSPRAHTVREVTAAEWVCDRQQPGLLFFQIAADGFLRCMVRNIVGTLVAVGRGALAPAGIDAILDSRDRRRAGPTAPARGLFLLEVRY